MRDTPHQTHKNFLIIFSRRNKAVDGKATIDLLKERLNKNIDDVEAAISLGNLYYDNGDAGQSVLYYRLALDIDPALSGVRTDLGAMYWHNENISLAERAFREAISRDSGFGQAYVNLGLLLHHAKGDTTGARSVWQQLVTADPGHAAADKARELLRETAH
ncbi:MAG: tetratricopeptide repeat protein [Gallionella sp.]|nr:MAG: tetratricopeptide repeat protein [Gallionella sp.]